MANIAQSVNVISPLTTTKTGLIKHTTWWPLLLFRKYMRGEALAVHVRCSEYQGLTEPKWIRGSIETPWLDVSASVSSDGWVTLAVVNIHETRDIETKIKGVPSDSKINVFVVTGNNTGVVNTEDKQEVGVTEGDWDGKGHYTFQKHSLTMLRWKA